MQNQDPSAFFRGQTIFLTGGTGGLGGCLLYKLALKVDARKIFILVRGSAAQAMASWAKTIPGQIASILATKKVHLMVGDITKRNCGIDPAILAEMGEQVTLVIHCAANTNLMAPIHQTIADNCIPTLQLAELASTFKNLSRFVHISTAYVNSFLPDGVVEEKIYDTGDAEQQLLEVMQTGSVSHSAPKYDWVAPYTFSKYLTERLLLLRNPCLPILIVRPTAIGPAISEPYSYYGPSQSCPVTTYIRTYMKAPDSGVFHVSARHPTGSNIVDEIPVDFVANIILLHIVHGTGGIVHAGAQSYVPRTLSQFHSDICASSPSEFGPFTYVTDRTIEQGQHAQFWKAASRDWHFSNRATMSFLAVKGPLSIALEGHDAARFMRNRVMILAEEVLKSRTRL
ncbi:male sterility protein-domain-containing protein [Mycena belliarum]|uniref:Fatty acyl-CoA reductase n=1 Tax=Mycena belliarum TaxID=1033014 RepID=A0AAD6UKH3_9AGAR|nr:male sterility protein-domain-containing protein [Mycena belliae]